MTHTHTHTHISLMWEEGRRKGERTPPPAPISTLQQLFSPLPFISKILERVACPHCPSPKGPQEPLCCRLPSVPIWPASAVGRGPSRSPAPTSPGGPLPGHPAPSLAPPQASSSTLCGPRRSPIAPPPPQAPPLYHCSQWGLRPASSLESCGPQN